MISEPVEQNVLVVVKTYPTPSAKYTETVCTAGITDKGEWIRLYPVKFRFLQDHQQYGLFSWITVKTVKSKTDTRPESFKVVNDEIRVGKKVDTKKGLNERKMMLLPLVKNSMEEIEDQFEKEHKSLAIFKPRVITNFYIDPESPDWSELEKSKLGQMSLFDTPDTIPTELKKVPYSFRCEYYCHNPECKGHKQKITIWDFNWAYFKYCEQYGDEQVALEKLKEKWFSYFASDKDGYLIVGTTHPYHSFIIIGVLSLKKGDNCYMQPLV
ncbi:MAG: hypothetical protein CVV04_09635 [Firmicutes bacterium HGW-Firmicutes-9]|jgi:hypothetical protein|nr:MAG: hypothetical protein CVV04_09635 [Firmicutes bacterium HGW-Firmicutes-9]